MATNHQHTTNKPLTILCSWRDLHCPHDPSSHLRSLQTQTLRPLQTSDDRMEPGVLSGTHHLDNQPSVDRRSGNRPIPRVEPSTDGTGQ